MTLGSALQQVVGPEIDRTPDHHLQQLEGSDEHGHLPRRTVPHRPQRVIRVHNRVDAVVHDDEPASASRVLGVAEPAVEEDGDVVVPVEEDEGLLPEDDEDGVAQFGELAQDEHPRPEAGDLVLFDEGWDANAVVKTWGYGMVWRYHGRSQNKDTLCK